MWNINLFFKWTAFSQNIYTYRNNALRWSTSMTESFLGPSPLKVKRRALYNIYWLLLLQLFYYYVIPFSNRISYYIRIHWQYMWKVLAQFFYYFFKMCSIFLFFQLNETKHLLYSLNLCMITNKTLIYELQCTDTFILLKYKVSIITFIYACRLKYTALLVCLSLH